MENRKKSNFTEVLEEKEWEQRHIMAENFPEGMKDTKSKEIQQPQARQKEVHT